MIDEVPTLFVGLYVFLEIIAFCCALAGFDQFQKGNIEGGFAFIAGGAVLFFFGLVGLRGCLNRKKPKPVSGTVEQAHNEISIISARYGVQNSWLEVTEGVRKQMKTTGPFIRASTSMLDVHDPKFGIEKQLVIRFMRNGKEYEVVVSEDESVNLATNESAVQKETSEGTRQPSKQKTASQVWDEMEGLWRQSIALKQQWLNNRDNAPIAEAITLCDEILAFCKSNLTINEIKVICSPFQPYGQPPPGNDDWQSDTSKIWSRLTNYEAYLQQFMRDIKQP